MSEGGIEGRKADHLELCAREQVESRERTTLLEQVRLLHQSLPELSVSEVELGVEFVGRRLRAPVLITGMTGGTEEAGRLNRELARAAQAQGVAFGVGSQRAMLERPERAETYRVRDVAPDVALLANLGAVQAARSSVEQVRGVVEGIEADALCVHMNPAQELIQADGDRDFRGCVEGIARLVEGLGVPVIVKETGCGVSAEVARRLVGVGVEWIDVSGAGGTTWVGVEALRARGGARALGEEFWDWGIPTAASVGFARGEGARVIASGGIRSGLEIAQALALGAELGGLALPCIRAAMAGGAEAVEGVLEGLIGGIRTALVLTGSRDVAALRRAPRVLGPELRAWKAAYQAG